jgi:hypothetical protein
MIKRYCAHSHLGLGFQLVRPLLQDLFHQSVDHGRPNAHRLVLGLVDKLEYSPSFCKRLTRDSLQLDIAFDASPNHCQFDKRARHCISINQASQISICRIKGVEYCARYHDTITPPYHHRQ